MENPCPNLVKFIHWSTFGYYEKATPLGWSQRYDIFWRGRQGHDKQNQNHTLFVNICNQIPWAKNVITTATQRFKNSWMLGYNAPPPKYPAPSTPLVKPSNTGPHSHPRSIQSQMDPYIRIQMRYWASRTVSNERAVTLDWSLLIDSLLLIVTNLPPRFKWRNRGPFSLLCQKGLWFIIRAGKSGSQNQYLWRYNSTSFNCLLYS